MLELKCLIFRGLHVSTLPVLFFIPVILELRVKHNHCKLYLCSFNINVCAE